MLVEDLNMEMIMDKYSISLQDWYDNYALEVELGEKEGSFLIAMKTLERIGIISHDETKIYQSCHIFTKRGKYYIVHFKELFALDGRKVDLNEYDIGRRNLIASLLEEWGIISIINPDKCKYKLPLSSIKIIKHSQIDDYDLVVKYKLGSKRV